MSPINNFHHEKKFAHSNRPFLNLEVTISERKVVGKESITTPVGTFRCYKITSKSNSKKHMGINMSFEFGNTEWIAEKAGMVKSESTDKKGNPGGSTVLSSRK